MKHSVKSLRPFIGAKNFELSRKFYLELGFTESVITDKMSVFTTPGVAFYLQDAYVKDWIENTMLFLEVDSADRYFTELKALDLPGKFEGAKVLPVRHQSWGKECFVLDPSGVLWHFGEFLDR